MATVTNPPVKGDGIEKFTKGDFKKTLAHLVLAAWIVAMVITSHVMTFDFFSSNIQIGQALLGQSLSRALAGVLGLMTGDTGVIVWGLVLLFVAKGKYQKMTALVMLFACVLLATYTTVNAFLTSFGTSADNAVEWESVLETLITYAVALQILVGTVVFGMLHPAVIGLLFDDPN